MTINYIRKYQLYLGFPRDYYKVPTEKGVNTGSYSNIIDGSAEGFNEVVPVNFLAVSRDRGILVEDLKVSATVEATNNSAGSDLKKATIKVYNLSPNNLSKISSKNVQVIFKVGYLEDYEKDNLPILFSGQVARVSSKKVGADTVTTLEVKDGYTPHTTVKVNKSLPSDYLNPITAVDVLEYLRKVWRESGVASSSSTIDYDFTLNSVKYYSGWTGTGYLKDIMDNFCESNSLEWYITNSTLYVQPKGGARVRELFKFSESNIISLEVGDTPKDSSSETQSNSRVMFTTFIDGRIKEGSYIEIPKNQLPFVKKDLAGTYRVVSVSHTFNSERGQSTTTCEGEKIK